MPTTQMYIMSHKEASLLPRIPQIIGLGPRSLPLTAVPSGAMLSLLMTTSEKSTYRSMCVYLQSLIILVNQDLDYQYQPLFKNYIECIGIWEHKRQVISHHDQ